MKKIKLEYLSAYFPYMVKAIFNEKNGPGKWNKVISTVTGIYEDSSIVCSDVVNSSPDQYKLLLTTIRPPEMDILIKSGSHRKAYDIGLKNHFDFFGLIKSGLAIEIETLKK